MFFACKCQQKFSYFHKDLLNSSRPTGHRSSTVILGIYMLEQMKECIFSVK